MAGCSKETPQKNFVARVNNAYLTRDDLARIIGTNSANNFYRNEVIRNWINQELLYQAAVKKGIIKEEEYLQLIDESKKKLAATLLIKKYYNDEMVSYEPADVEKYYDEHKDEFKRFYDSFLLNLISFKDEDKAEKFRSIVLESDWEKALNVFKTDSSIIYAQTNQLLYDYEVHPAELSRIVTNMAPNEVSIVINDEAGHYSVVQEIQKFEKDSIPPFQAVKSIAESRYVEQKKEELVSSYIKELYSNNEIEVRN